MTSRLARLAATAGAVALLGTLAAAVPAAAAASVTTGTASAQQAAAWHFIDWYPDRTACERGGAYYLRHGYTAWRCELEVTRGWALMVRD